MLHHFFEKMSVLQFAMADQMGRQMSKQANTFEAITSRQYDYLLLGHMTLFDEWPMWMIFTMYILIENLPVNPWRKQMMFYGLGVATCF